MKTLMSKVVYEDIHIEDYDKRRHHMNPMELEVIGTTVLLSGVQENQSE